MSPAVRIDVATGTTDLRRSIDGLAALVRERFDLDPLSGHLFLFRNRRGDRLKIHGPYLCGPHWKRTPQWGEQLKGRRTKDGAGTQKWRLTVWAICATWN